MSIEPLGPHAASEQGAPFSERARRVLERAEHRRASRVEIELALAVLEVLEGGALVTSGVARRASP